MRDSRLTPINKAQRRALFNLYNRAVLDISYRQFRRNVVPMVGTDCALVNWCGMWVAIEPDGYMHT